jgi:hypothetical protein
MVKRHLRMISAVLAGAALTLWTPAAATAEENDLREFRLGTRADELPRTGYVGFACSAPPFTKLAGWRDYAKCPPDAAGLHEIRFRYDSASDPMALVNEDFEGTRVAGHPVHISLMIGGTGHLEGIRIRTNPGARLYLRKKAFLLGRQVLQRYGEEGWSCTKREPSTDEEPIGGVFMKEHCEKTTATRRFILDRQLFRRAGKALKFFVSNTELLILRKQ